MAIFRILGPVRALADEGELPVGGRRQLTLLAFLLLNANRAVSTDALTDAIWGPNRSAGDKRLHMAIARLRKALEALNGPDGPRLRTVSGGYLLAVENGELDADLFAARVQGGRAAVDLDPVQAVELVDAALALWRGPPLADVAFEDFAQPEIRRLEELHLVALESRIEAQLRLGRHRDVVGQLEALVAQYPTREHFAGQLMLALYRTGHQADALDVYQRTRIHLAEELGLDPGPTLTGLQTQILDQARDLAEPNLPDAGRPGRPARRQVTAPLLGDGFIPPVGTIALLFTDIDESTRLASELARAWPEVLEVHHAALRTAIEDNDGFVAAIEGGAFFATFRDAAAAARAALGAMRALHSRPWPGDRGRLGVRMGLHVGFVEWSATGYAGLEVHRAARVAAAAHGGQLLMTAAASALIGGVVKTEPLGLHRLKDFPTPEWLYCAVIDGRGAASFPPPRTPSVRPTNLPAGLPRLVGRSGDVQRVRKALLIDGERVVTLTGQGGVGKTSLALVCGEGLLDDFAGGIWLVSLATLTSPEEVLPTIERVLAGERSELSDPPSRAIATRLRGRGKTLLILDNFEHMLGATASVVQLVDAAPELSVLITSQGPLRLSAERVLPIASLDEPAALSLVETVALQRATMLTDRRDEREALKQIVSILDGLPLALELATARLSLLTPTELAERLRGSLDVLQEDRRDRPQRHRSLRATVQWTLDSLDLEARKLFVRLGGFAGPVELGEIELITGGDSLDVISALSVLVDVALVRRIEFGDSRIRFGLPEALRQSPAQCLTKLLMVHSGARPTSCASMISYGGCADAPARPLTNEQRRTRTSRPPPHCAGPRTRDIP